MRTGRKQWSRNLGDRTLINRVPLTRAPEEIAGDCPGLPLLLSEMLVVHYRQSERPKLVDFATGENAWRGSFASPVVAVDGDIAVLLRDAGTDPAGAHVEFVAVDITGGRERWRRLPALRGFGRFGGFGAVGGVFAFDGQALSADGRVDPIADLRVADARNGRQLWRARDAELIGMGDGWLVARFPAFGGPGGKPATIKYFPM
ncbi:MAG: hypothetical protein ACRDTU_00120 [Micromonosporaceae bacterium]